MAGRRNQYSSDQVRDSLSLLERNILTVDGTIDRIERDLVVGFCEADHAATADDIIESCKISRRVIHDCLLGTLNPLDDKEVLNRKNELVREAKVLIAAIRLLGDESSKDPLLDSITYVRAVKKGVLDAPHLRNNPIAQGLLGTKMIDGACLAIDPSSGTPIDEATRLRQLDQEIASEYPLKRHQTTSS